MAGAQARVSTLFTRVGLSRRPLVASSGGRFRGCARRSSIASSKALCSPQMYPPGLTNTLTGNRGPHTPAASASAIAARTAAACSGYSWRI